MIDETQQEILFRYLDGDTSEHENQQLEKMLANSSELRALQQDMLDLSRNSKLPDYKCPGHLEHIIRSKLQEKYPYHQRDASKDWITSSQLRIAAAAVVLIGIAAPFSYLSLDSETSDRALIKPSVDRVLDDITIARDQYLAAIAELESLAIVRMEQLPDDLAMVFAENLQILDEAITLYESNRDTNNPYLFSHYTLSDIYELKVELLTTVLEV